MTPYAKETEAFLQELVALGATVSLAGDGKLNGSFPRGVLTDELRERVKRYKPGIIGLLQHSPEATEKLVAQLLQWRDTVTKLSAYVRLLERPAWQPVNSNRANAIAYLRKQIEQFAASCPDEKGYPDASDPFADEAVTLLRAALWKIEQREEAIQQP